MKKNVVFALLTSLLLSGAFSLGFAKKTSVLTPPPVTSDGFHAWSS